MNKPVLNISAEENKQLDRLVHGFKKLNGFHKVELYQVTDKEVIIGAKKFIAPETGEEDIRQYRRIFIKALKDMYRPFTGERKVYVHLRLGSCLHEPFFSILQNQNSSRRSFKKE